MNEVLIIDMLPDEACFTFTPAEVIYLLSSVICWPKLAHASSIHKNLARFERSRLNLAYCRDAEILR